MLSNAIYINVKVNIVTQAWSDPAGFDTMARHEPIPPTRSQPHRYRGVRLDA